MTGEIIRKIVDIIFIILDIIIIGYVLYFFITGLFAFKKEKKKNKSKEKLKFAVLIPARNEENIIDNLILSLQAQKYPKENYDIFVILNNCTDKTEEIVKELGVNVINCIPGIKIKERP